MTPDADSLLFMKKNHKKLMFVLGCLFFKMNSVKFMFATLLLTAVVEITEEQQENRLLAYASHNFAPLALIREPTSNSSFRLAIPHKSDSNERLVSYYYEKDEEFVAMCPAEFDHELSIQTEWRKNKGKENDVIFFKREHILDCSHQTKVQPSVTKLRKSKEQNIAISCGRNEAEGSIYGVGFPAWNEIKEEIVFITIYQICYSEKTGMIYSNHQILSPSLVRFRDYYEPNLKFSSFLDKDEKKSNQLNNKLLYQFVTSYDMPTYNWELTTLFPFNIIPIENTDILKYLTNIDNYIRFFSLMKNQSLTLYSGIHIDWPANSIWRVVMDYSETQAIVIVTQIAVRQQLKSICTDEEIILFWKNSICVYTCLLNEVVSKTLHLPQFRETTELDLKIPKTSTQDEGSSNTQFMVKEANLADFVKSKTNIDVLLESYNRELGASVRAEYELRNSAGASPNNDDVDDNRRDEFEG
ncbi:uncharacterized protein LOC135838761 [Planococcus citri]|uniref:uncharacterized protein LOC135838761 n=1 Tax=Planococcus citri TaxID=170843 RepID=UPI0031F83BA9